MRPSVTVLQTIHFIRCGGSFYQGFCPRHERRASDPGSNELTFFWDLRTCTMRCLFCGFSGRVEHIDIGQTELGDEPPPLLTIRLTLSVSREME